jgi:hypothetical protein
VSSSRLIKKKRQQICGRNTDRSGNAADHAVRQQISNGTGRQILLDERAQRGERRVDELHRHLGEEEQRPEQTAHHHHERAKSDDRMREQAIHALGKLPRIDGRVRRSLDDRLTHRARPRRDRSHVAHPHPARRAQARPRPMAFQRGAEGPAADPRSRALATPPSTPPDTEPGRQRVGIDDETPARRDVHHVETDDETRVRGQQLADENQMPAQI